MFATDAPAKINFFLHVTGQRDDGYHLLDSLIAFTALNDIITIRPATGFSLTLDGPFCAGLDDGEDNLVLRAARALASLRGADGGALITLTKNLPVSAGMGGGSADAAATLRLLDRMWGTAGPQSESYLDGELMALALKLGADVPVCLFGRTARVGGIGEEIAPTPPLPAYGLVVVNSGVAVPTDKIFAALEDGQSRPADLDENASSVDVDDGFLRAIVSRRNNLTPAAERFAPEITAVLEALGDSDDCLLARMTGSGATCFGIFADASPAGAAAYNLAESHPDWWVRHTTFIDRLPLIHELD